MERDDGTNFGGGSVIAESIIGCCMELIGSALRRYVDGAGRGQLGGEIKLGLAYLKFLNSALRDILGRGANRFIAHIHAIQLDARGAPETATHGNPDKAGLGGMKITAVLDLNPGFKLCQFQEVAPVADR